MAAAHMKQAFKTTEENFEFTIRSFWTNHIQFGTEVHKHKSSIQAFVKNLLGLIEENPGYTCSPGTRRTWAWEAGRIGASLTFLLISRLKPPLNSHVSSRNNIEEDEVTAYLLGDEVGGLMRKLATLSNGSLSLLEGMAEAFILPEYERTFSFCAVIDYVVTDPVAIVALVKFMYNSVVNKQRECLCKETCSLLKILQFCARCTGFKNITIDERNRKSSPIIKLTHEFPTTEIEEIVFPLVQDLLQTETRQSLNMTCVDERMHFTVDIMHILSKQRGLSGGIADMVAMKRNRQEIHLLDVGNSSALHFAAGFLFLPRVTKLLLSNPDIDVNITEEGAELTPLDVALQAMFLYNYTKTAVLETIYALLDHPKFHCSNVSKGFGWAIVRSFALLKQQNNKGHLETVMDVLDRVVSHPSCLQSAEYVMDILFTLVMYYPILHEINENCYNKILDKVLTSQFTDVIQNHRISYFHLNSTGYEQEGSLSGSVIELLLDHTNTLLINMHKLYNTTGFWFGSDSSIMCLIKRMTNHTSFNVSKCDSDGNNILMKIATRIFYLKQGSINSTTYDDYARELELLRISLDHETANVTAKNIENKRPVDICIDGFMTKINDGRLRRNTLFYLHFLEVLNGHNTSTANHIHCSLIAIIKAYRKLEEDPAFEERQNFTEEFGHETFKMSSHTMIHKVIKALCHNANFEVNCVAEPTGKTVAHIAAENNNVSILKLLIEMENFDPNIPDKDGNTPAFSIVRYVKRCEDVGFLLKTLKPKLDLSLTNMAGQTIQHICEFIEQTATRKTIERILNDELGIAQAALIDNHDVTRPPAEIQGHDIQLHLMPGQPTSNNTICKVTMETMKRIIKSQQDKKLGVYDMTGPRKGKVCIISIHRFQVPWLQTLDGYSHDRLQLQQLWQEMGFQVYMPRTVQPYDDNLITAQEIECAVRKFAESLEADDSCAVLCILSHGGNGFVYGVDGKRVTIKCITSYLNNENCPQMMDKPKVVIIQACNGDQTDRGVLAAGTSTSEVIPAARQELLPSISDTIIIHPSQPEFVSYVYRTPGEGSVLIKHLTQIFREYAATEDIHTLLTRINKEVSDLNLPHVPAPGVSQEYKQMPEFRSSMRRLLYFFPLSAEEPRSPDIRMEGGAHDVTDEMMDVSAGNIADVTSAVHVLPSDDIINDVHENKDFDLSSDVKGIPFSDVTVPVAGDPKDEHTDEKQQRTLRTSLKRQRSDSPGDDKAKSSKQ